MNADLETQIAGSGELDPTTDFIGSCLPDIEAELLSVGCFLWTNRLFPFFELVVSTFGLENFLKKPIYPLQSLEKLR